MKHVLYFLFGALVVLTIRMLYAYFLTASIRRKLPKVFHYFDIKAITLDNANKNDLYISELFHRYRDDKAEFGFILSDLYNVICAQYEVVNDQGLTILTNLYLLSREKMDQIIKEIDIDEITEDILIDHNAICLSYSLADNEITLYGGHLRVDELSLKIEVTKCMYDIITELYKKVCLQGKSYGIELVDYKSLREFTKSLEER